MVERARLESWYRGNSIGGSNPPVSARSNQETRSESCGYLRSGANEARFGELLNGKSQGSEASQGFLGCF